MCKAAAEMLHDVGTSTSCTSAAENRTWILSEAAPAAEPDDDIETIRVHVRHLRTKLEPDPRKPRFIKTVYGAGYCLELPSDAQLASSSSATSQASRG